MFADILLHYKMDEQLDTFFDEYISRKSMTKCNDLSKQLEKLQAQIKANDIGDKEFIKKGQKIIEQEKCLYNLYLKQNKGKKQKLLKNIFFHFIRWKAVVGQNYLNWYAKRGRLRLLIGGEFAA